MFFTIHGGITKMGAGGNMITNSKSPFDNKYKPGGGGVGASTIANRRARDRSASICGASSCSNYMLLGLYSHNPNGVPK